MSFHAQRRGSAEKWEEAPLPLYALHDVPIQFDIADAEAARRIEAQWRRFAAPAGIASRPIHIALRVETQAPGPPQLPVASSGSDVTYFRRGQQMSALFPGWGRCDVNLATDRIEAIMGRAAVATYGVFEDMLLIALLPLLRRRQLYAIHAFAAAVAGRALLILGDTGAGKTTTGISLLARGAGLVANDSPLLRPNGADAPRVHAYPGLLSAYPDSIARFPVLARRPHLGSRLQGSDKISFAAESVWPDVWVDAARPAALVFPVITPGQERSRLQPLSTLQALQHLVAQSIEDWDNDTIPAHLRALRQLVEAAPAWRLILAPDIPRLPDLLLPLVG